MKREDLRRKAEERIAASRAGESTAPASSEGDLRSPVHELQVHQIELEMQNDELQRTQAEAEDSRARWAELFDSAPLGYVTLDGKGLIRDINLAGARLLNSDRSSLVGHPIVGSVAPESRAALAAMLAEARQAAGKASCEIRLLTGVPAPVEASLDAVLLPRKSGPGELIQIAMTDVTERNRTEAEKSRLVLELQESLAHVKKLTGLLPICASCKRIRDDSGYWQQVEEYVSSHSEAEFTHGLCPECMVKLYPEHRR